jgi:hypothetical protein
LDEKSCDLKLQPRQREVKVLRFSTVTAEIGDPKMKLARIQPEKHCLWPKKSATRAQMLRSKIAPSYTAVGEDRFSLVPDEAGAPSSVQQAG